jgi:hypothetical protein
VRVEAAVRKTNHSGAGAYLYCEKLMCKRIQGDLSAMKEWGKRNANAILRMAPATKKYGFFVMTAIHSVEACQLKCWSQTMKSLSPNLSVTTSLVPIGSVFEGQHGTSGTSSGWVTRPNDDERGLVRLVRVSANQ